MRICRPSEVKLLHANSRATISLRIDRPSEVDPTSLRTSTSEFAEFAMDRDMRQEYVDALIIYGEYGRNARRAAMEYNNRYPNRRPINHNLILRLERRLLEAGVLCRAPRGEPGRNVDNDEIVLRMVNRTPTTSVREIGNLLNISKSTVHRILKIERMHPYHYSRVHDLLPRDSIPRLEFCEWILHRDNETPGFARHVMFTDESCFARDGAFNTHNSHVWAVENPHSFHVRNYQQRFSVNLWAGIVDGSLIGPFELPARVTGQIYADFLRDSLPELLENLPLAVRRTMFLQHDGAPPHASMVARRILDQMYPGRWIGRGGPVNWPARSPDLTPMDYFLWGHFKQIVYRDPVNTREELTDRIMEALALIDRRMIEETYTNLLRRARLCLQCEGGHFEHLL